MADAISKKNNSQTYLRQIQQEKAKYKRELMEAQRNDMKELRDYYNEQNKQLEQESAAAIVEIKQQARDMAAADKQERATEFHKYAHCFDQPHPSGEASRWALPVAACSIFARDND